MSILTLEGSQQSSEPRIGIEFILPVLRYRVTTGTRDIEIDGATYYAFPSAYEELKIGQIKESDDLGIQIPVGHPVVQRYLANGVPPRRLSVVVRRMQASTGEFEIVWQGNVTSLSVSKKIASMRVPARLGAQLNRSLPTITVSRLCPHVLYDPNCKASRATYSFTTSVANVADRLVTVSSVDSKPDQWFRYGELIHTSSGERMTIQDQTGKKITMQLGIYEMRVGDAIVVSAGCEHDITTCDTKFDNKIHHGGFPMLNTEDIFKPTGLGISVQS